MIYPENFEYKIGFEPIRKMIAEGCISNMGRKKTQALRFSSHPDTISRLLNQTEEFRQIILLEPAFPALYGFDPFPVFGRIKPQGTFIEADEMGELRYALKVIKSIVSFLEKRSPNNDIKYPALFALSERVDIDDAITREMDMIIDEQNMVRNQASAKLAEIRSKIAKYKIQASNRISQIFNEARKQSWVSDDTELALRNGRLVIPVASAYKRRIKGFVHDQSSTGQTVFLEPEEVFELNNEILQLQTDERSEIIRILKSFTDFLRPMLPELKTAFHFLGIIDFIRSKAKLAIEMNAMKPHLVDKPYLNWINARHPLLFLSFKEQNKNVVPLTLQLNEKQRIVLISGPNAGGKSVCMKTVGLVQYMIQCGMLAPMEDYSEAGIFKKLFIDIGDEQSIENDLSTYSSHLKNMRKLLLHACKDTLFLIDEFGSGTEPGIGGSIAESILEELAEKKSFGVVTTHYANLKIMAGKTEGVLNGSMLFDTQKMKPLYQLKTGTPGSSFAFEIAKMMGLPENILSRASQIAGAEKIDFDRQLQTLELKKLEIEQKEKQMRAGDAFLSEMIEKYQKLSGELETNKKRMMMEAKTEAQKVLKDANRLIEKTIREIRETDAEKVKTQKLRKEVAAEIKNLHVNEKDLETIQNKDKKKKKNNESNPPAKLLTDHSPISKGDIVRVVGQQLTGEVVEMGDKEATVAFGSVLMKTPLKNLEKIRKDSVKKQPSKVKVKYDFDINTKATEFNPHLDLRGEKLHDAMTIARRFLDDAILLGLKNLKIVHGTGEGVLREAIRDYLRTLPEVKRFKDEHPDRGGAGCTLIELSS
ncbi:MAG: endonuclease MutS2 [Bacteroidota bacterium]